MCNFSFTVLTSLTSWRKTFNTKKTQNSLNNSQGRKKCLPEIEKITLTDLSAQGLTAVNEKFVL